MLILDICLSDLPSEAITTGKNGKKYIKLVCAERKTEGKFGETHYIALSQSKEEREAKKPATYVGGAKSYNNVTNKNATPAKSSIPDVVKDEYANSMYNDNSLPF
jgi:hypothetical protein